MPHPLSRRPGLTAAAPVEVPDGRVENLSAAGARLDGVSQESLHANIVGNEAWQTEAWRQYDITPELGYVTRFEANAISQARLHAAILPEHGEGGDAIPIEDEDHPANQAIDALFGGRHAHAEALRRLSPQLTVAGISYIVATDKLDDIPTLSTKMRGDGRHWFVLSNDEIQVAGNNADSRITLHVAGQSFHRRRDDLTIIRVWTPHPRQWWRADSPVRRLLPVLRELEGLTKHVGATIDSRLTGAGILLVPQEMTFPSSRDDVPEGVDPFVWELIDAAATSIKDRSSASALVPIVLKVPGDLVDKVTHLRFDTPFDDAVAALREAAIRRLAMGLEVPAEILLGLSEVNHLSAFAVDESSIKMHTQPKLDAMTDALTSAWVHPVLREQLKRGEITEDDLGVPLDRLVMGVDLSALKLRPNRSNDAAIAWDRMLIDDKAMRRALGFGEDDAPDSANLEEQILRYIVVNAPQLALDILPTLGIEVNDKRNEGDGSAGSNPAPPDTIQSNPDDQPADREAASTVEQFLDSIK